MPAPYPQDAVAGRVQINAKARAVYGNYVWLARLSDEMVSDPEIYMKKLGMFSKHCRDYVTVIDDLQINHAGAMAAVESVFSQNNIEWPTRADMRRDLRAIYDAASPMVSWIEETYPKAKTGHTQQAFDDSYMPIEVYTTREKSEDFAAKMGTFRGLFGAKE